MIAVMHLFDDTADVEDLQTRTVITTLSPANVICTSLGIGPGKALRDPIAGASHVRRLMPDVVHAWGDRGLMAAALGAAPAIIYSPVGRSDSPSRLLRWISRYRKVHAVCSTDAEREALCSAHGVARCRVIRPALSSVVPDQSVDARHHARRSLGLNETDIVVLAIGESTRSAAHASAVWATGILNVLDPRYKLLLWGRGPMATAAVQLAEKMKQRDMVVVAERPGESKVSWESVVGAADMGLLTAVGPVATLPIATCMAGGLRLVATAGRVTSDLLQPHTALMAADHSPRTLARCVLDVGDNPAAATARAKAAEILAGQLFAEPRLRQAFGELYSQAAGVAAAPRPMFGRPLRIPRRPQNPVASHSSRWLDPDISVR